MAASRGAGLHINLLQSRYHFVHCQLMAGVQIKTSHVRNITNNKLLPIEIHYK